MLASVSVLGRAELGSFGVIICVGIEMFIVNFIVHSELHCSVLKKMCHWKEADTTICICCGANQEPGDPNESDDSWTSRQVSAGWAKVMTVTIPHFRHHHMKYIKKTVRSIEYVWRTMAAERCYICGHCNDCVVNLEYEHPADWLEDLSAFTEMLELRSCPWRCPDKDRPQ